MPGKKTQKTTDQMEDQTLKGEDFEETTEEKGGEAMEEVGEDELGKLEEPMEE